MAWKSIVCAVDESPGADAALGVAARLARQLDAKLLLVHVQPAAAGESLLAPPPAMVAAKRLEPERWTAVASDLSGKPVSLRMLSGNAPQALVDFARESACDAVVLGSRAHHRVTLALGSVAAKVIVEAPCPVLVVSPKSRERELLRQDFPGQVA